MVNPPIPLITEQLHPVDNTSVENRDNSPPSAPEGATPPAPAGADHQEEVPSNQGPQRSLGELPSSRSGRRRWKSSRLQALDQKVKHSPINQAFLASSKPRLQRDIATSTMEAEYNALSMAMKDLLPLRTVFETVGRALELSSDITSTFITTVWEDNMAEAGEEENWGGLGEDKNLTTPHNRYYETVKHATHEACDLLDNIHSQVSPSCAISLYTEYQKALDEIRDKCRAALRETNTSLNIRDGSSTPVVHNIAGPPLNRTVRRTLHSFNANPRSAKRHRLNI